MNNSLLLLTDSFPYGKGETFLETEIRFLSEGFETVHLFPLHGKGAVRTQFPNVVVHEPFLSFHPKRQSLKLLLNGLFNTCPCWFAVKELIAKSIYKKPAQLRTWLAATLVFRAACANHDRLTTLHFLSSDNQTVVYSYWGDKLAFLIPFLKKKNPAVKSIARFHRTDLYEEFKSGYVPFRSLLLPALDHCVCIAENGEQYLMQRYPTLIRRIHLFRLGVFNHGTNPSNTGKFHLVSCSFMVPVKRISLLIDALKLIDFPLTWTHIGIGALYDQLTNQAKQLPDNVEVEFWGEKTNAEVLEYYKTVPIDLFINVSASEGVPVSIMEALSFGIPVIATDAGGSGEIVDDSVGKLLPVAIDAKDISYCITDFYNNNDTQIYRDNAKKRWQERCDAEKNYSEFVTFLKNV